MIDEIGKLLDDYRAWLKDKTTLREVKDWVEITTPYLDRHNDYIQIYARKDNGAYVLTDDGYTIRDLEHSGCKLESTKRRDLLGMTLNGFGISQKGDELTVRATSGDFAQRKHNLLQSILAVNDLFYLAEPYVASLFYEEVVAWLDLLGVRYTPRVAFRGKSGLEHTFQMVIPRSPDHPERILLVINHPNRDAAQAAAFSWLDTKETRPVESSLYAVINDSEQPIPPQVSDALRNYDITAVPWSKRDTVRERLRN
jgi:hypothetical protein